MNGAWILYHSNVCTPWRSVFFVSENYQQSMHSPYKNYDEWFTLFEDFTGAFISVYYPIKLIENESINVIVSIWGKGKIIKWEHGKKGLALKIQEIQSKLDRKLFGYG